jgi:hypothetical protein
MKERPILFNAKMVNAILSGKKLVTRRIMTPEPLNMGKGLDYWHCRKEDQLYCIQSRLQSSPEIAASLCPFGNIGDRLWVRESIEREMVGDDAVVKYRADGAITGLHPWDYNKSYAPSIHMKRKHSRITLEIRYVRVERLHDITETDAKHEGVAAGFLNPMTGNVCTEPMYTYGFAKVWESTGAKWKENPWVWVIGFKVV